MEDLQTYRARIGLFRHRMDRTQKGAPHKQSPYRQRNRSKGQDKWTKSNSGSNTKLKPDTTLGKMTSGILRLSAIIVTIILLVTGVTSGHMKTGQIFTENELHTNSTESHVNCKCLIPALQQNYVIPSSVHDCLLGNAGVHMYNGNPVNNENADMNQESNADTPTDDQLLPSLNSGGETLVMSQSKQADQIQQLEIEILKQHATMITKLRGYISPDLRNDWDVFLNKLCPYLAKVEIKGSNVRFVGDLCESLLKNGSIKYGEYEVLLEAVEAVDIRAGEFVRNATTAIKDIKIKISSLKPEVGSGSNKRFAQTPEDFSPEYTRQSAKDQKINTRQVQRTIDVSKQENMINQTEKWIQWNRRQFTFITTKALNVAVDALKKTNLLLIRGNCGDGKSTLAMEIMAWLMGDRKEQGENVQCDNVNWRKNPLLLKELKSWDETVLCNANLAIFIDDIFGYSSEYSEDLLWWKKIAPFIRPVLDGPIGTNANCMVITVRNDVYEEHRSLFCHEDMFTDSMIDLSSSQKLQIEEKKSILRSYMPNSVELSRDDETTIAESDLPFGFPECCRIFNSLEDMHGKPREYFLRPLVCIKQMIRDRFSESRQSALFFLLLGKGKVSVNQLETYKANVPEDDRITLAMKISSGDTLQSSRTIIKEELEAMIGSLVKLESNTFTFYHDVVEDAVAILYGEITPHKFLQHVDISHLRYVGTSQKKENELHIKAEYIECLYSRILAELKTRETKRYDVLITMRIWDDESFVRDFVVWVRKQGKSNLVQMKLALDQACLSGSEKCALQLLENGITPDSNTCLCVVKGGSLVLLNKLILLNIYPETTTDDDTFHVKNVNMLQLACLYEKEELALRLAQNFPMLLKHRDADNNSVLHHIAMTNNTDLFGKIAKMLSFESQDLTSFLQRDDKTTVLHLAFNYQQQEIKESKKAMYMYISKMYPSLISQQDNDGWHCLHYAAGSGDVEFFMYLNNIVNEGKSETEIIQYMEILLTNDDKTVLHAASAYGKKAMCSYLCETYPSLISQRDNDGWHCLHRAAQSGDVDCFMYLTNFVNEGKRETEIKQYIGTLRTRDGLTVLHIASRSGKKSMCSHLCETYPLLISQRDNYGWHCLHRAAQSGDVDCFMYITNFVNEGKCETEIKQCIETLRASYGSTVLHIASRSGEKSMCSHLCETYPSLISQRNNNGLHCLHFAAQSGDVDCFVHLNNIVTSGKSETEISQYMETLLTSDGETVLHQACLKGKKFMYAHICETYPSLISQRDYKGRHCYQDAANFGDVDCYVYLDTLVNEGKR